MNTPDTMQAAKQVIDDPEFKERIERLKASFAKCPHQSEEEYEKQRKAENHRRNVDELRVGWQVPARHLENRSKLVRSGPWNDTLNHCLRLIGSGFIVALIGGRGSGKTQIGVELMHEATNKLRTARFCTTTEFFMRLKATFKSNSDETEEMVVREYRRPKMLVMDEVGRKGETAWHDNLLFELINARYNDMKDTVLICNLTPAALTEAIGPALVDRINESGGVIECNWKGFMS